MAENRTLSIFKKIGKVGLWIVGILFTIVLLLVVALQLPAVQHFLTTKATYYLENKLQTRVEVGGISVAFPKKVVLEDVYLEDQQRDTLLFSHRLAVNIDMMGLLNNSVNVSSIELETLTGHINRTLPDSSFNFDFIVNAFADSTTITEKDTTSKPWKISIDNVSLKNIYTTYKDEVSKQEAILRLGELDLSFKTLDMERSIYAVKELTIARTSVFYTSTAPPAAAQTSTQTDADTSTSSSSPPPTLGLDKLTLNDVHVRYYNQSAGQNLKADIGESRIETDVFDLTGQEIALNEFLLKNSVIRYQQEARKQQVPTPAAAPATASRADTSAAWQVSLANLSLADNHIIYDDFNAPAQAAGMDFSHLLISNIGIEADDISYQGNTNTILANIKAMQMREKSGFVLKDFKANFQMTDKKAEARGFRLQTGHSLIEGNLLATYRSLEKIADEYAGMGLDIQIPNARLAVQDLLYFQPNVLKTLPVRLPKNTVLTARASIRGQVKNLAINEFQASTLNNTRLVIRGNIRNLPDINRTTMQLAIVPFETSSLDIRTIVPPAMLPTAVRIPQHIQLTTTLSGAVHNMNLQAQLRTTLGSIIANTHLKTNRDFSNGSYHADLKMNNFALGKLLKQEKDLGNITATAKLNGSGFALKQMRAQLVARIRSVVYKKYTYRNIAIDGLAHPSQFAANISLLDTNLNFTFVGSADFRKNVPNYVAVLDLKNADLKKLNLSEREMRTRVRIMADLNFKSVDSINGKVDIRQMAVASAGKIYTIDSLLYVSVQEKHNTDIKFESDLFSGYFRGNVNWSGLYGALERHLTRYYPLPNTPPYSETDPQNFEFELKLRNTSLLTEILVPDLDSLRPGTIRGKFDSRRAQLDIMAQIYSMKYAGTRIDTAVLLIDSDPKRLQATFSVENIRQGSIRLRHLSLINRAADNNLTTELIIRDSVYRQKYLLAGTFRSQKNNIYSFHFFPDSVRLNYKPWQVQATNAIVMGKDGLRLTDLVFSESTQQFSLANVNNQPSSLRAGFENFRIETLTEMISADTSLASGLLNGQLSMFRQGTNPVLTADMKITDLHYTGQPVGNLSLIAAQKQHNRFDVRLELTDNNNAVDVQGYYLANGGANALHFDANIRQLNLKSFETFAKEQLNELSGNATGQFQIRGSTAKPSVAGALTFQNALLNLKMLDSPFRLDNQTMRLDPEGIHFRNFTILDSASRNIVVNGDILTQDFSYYKLQMRITSDRFQVLNTTSKDNSLYYGKLFASSTIVIRGDSYKPVVTANLKIESGTNVTYVVPQSDDAVAGREGIVRFVDMGTAQDPFIQKIKAETQADTAKAALRGYEFSTNIEIDSTSTFNVVVDPVAGDQLSGLKGRTNLSLTIDPSGSMDLSGRYEILAGTYSLSFYGLVQRQFQLDRNSSITWAGDPYTARMDIRAIYRVETSPTELVKNRVTDPGQLNKARQRIPFSVILKLRGQLLKPQISFELNMPEDKKGILNNLVWIALQDVNSRESELNKQVFSLFLLQRFMTEDPFESSGSGGVEQSVRGSVSKMLTDQLNRLTDKIKGVELELDVNSYSDYGSGNAQGRTDLELGVSKNLFNDRVIVKVTGNVNLEGRPADSQQDLSNFLGDLQLEYKLTEDGRLRLLGFRRRDFDIISGELTRTGGGVIFVRDYNSFRELFTKALEE